MPCSPPKNWGYSHKIGPVYLSDREDTISPKKKDEIEDEVRRYVSSHVTVHSVSAPLPIERAPAGNVFPGRSPMLLARIGDVDVVSAD